jgi:UDP-2,4-diacetamido-2,4,6-trideoxy-beta-L-altropyranose hydrolase
MIVVFRVDSSYKIGAGHLMRCLALAIEFEKKRITVNFICRKLNGNLIKEIKFYGFCVIELETHIDNKIINNLGHSGFLEVTQQQDAKECIDILGINKIDLLVVDHYGINKDWHIELQKHCKELMVIDDLANREYSCSALLDQSYNRTEDDYNGLVPKKCQLLLGPKYALLRSEFSKWRGYSLSRRKNPKLRKLLITMGSVDINNITEEVLITLEGSTLISNIEITVLMMENAPHIEKIKEKAKSMFCNVVVQMNAKNIAEIMANSDIVIGASGSSSLERFCLGLPAIQFSIAKNQMFTAKSFADNNLIKLVTSVEQIHSLLINPEIWMSSISFASSKVCDGFGTCRVLKKMRIFDSI